MIDHKNEVEASSLKDNQKAGNEVDKNRQRAQNQDIDQKKEHDLVKPQC